LIQAEEEAMDVEMSSPIFIPSHEALEGLYFFIHNLSERYYETQGKFEKQQQKEQREKQRLVEEERRKRSPSKRLSIRRFPLSPGLALQPTATGSIPSQSTSISMALDHQPSPMHSLESSEVSIQDSTEPLTQPPQANTKLSEPEQQQKVTPPNGTESTPKRITGDMIPPVSGHALFRQSMPSVSSLPPANVQESNVNEKSIESEKDTKEMLAMQSLSDSSEEDESDPGFALKFPSEVSTPVPGRKQETAIEPIVETKTGELIVPQRPNENTASNNNPRENRAIDTTPLKQDSAKPQNEPKDPSLGETQKKKEKERELETASVCEISTDSTATSTTTSTSTKKPPSDYVSKLFITMRSPQFILLQNFDALPGDYTPSFVFNLGDCNMTRIDTYTQTAVIEEEDEEDEEINHWEKEITEPELAFVILFSLSAI
jgi:hypothetical protein